MTIVAGFVHDAGVLLCSDTQMETDLTKITAPKIAHFEYPEGKVAMAFAGNATSAISAIQKVGKLLKNLPPNADVVADIEAILECQYRRLVHKDPDYGKKNSFDLYYWLIVALWVKAENKTYLFATDDVKMVSIDVPYYCSGVAREFANFVIAPIISPTDQLSEEDAMFLATFMLTRIKDSVQGTGGISQFLSVRNDGTVTPVAEIVVSEIERVAEVYEGDAHRLLFSAASVNDALFEERLTTFNDTIRKLRRAWKTVRLRIQ